MNTFVKKIPFLCGRAYRDDGSLGPRLTGLFNGGNDGADLYLLSLAGSIGLTLNIGRLFSGGSESLVSLSGVLARERPLRTPGSSVRSPVDNAACFDFLTD